MDAKTLCLGVLTMGDASGYEIKKQFEEGPLSYFHAAGFGSIYPALGKLTENGMVTFEEMVQEGRPDKKVYTITDAGRDELKRTLRKTPARDRIQSEACFMLFMAEYMDPAHVREVYEDYLNYYRSTILKLEARAVDCREIPSQKLFVRGIGMAIYKAIVAYMEENGHLLFEDTLEDQSQAGEATQ